MSDLINRQDAIALVDRPIVPTGDAVYDNAREDERASIKDDLASLPSAEPKHGEWIYKNGLRQFFCSECGYPSLTHDDVYIYGMDLPNYCSNCGSYNGGEEE